MTDRIDQAVKELAEVRKLLRRGTHWKRRAVSPSVRRELEKKRDQLSKEIWESEKSFQYSKQTIRAINDPDEIREEMRRVHQDIKYPWFYYYGVNVDKEELWSYSRYLQIKLFDLTRQDHEVKYLTGVLSVNKPEIIEYFMAERGIDLRSLSVIGVYGESDDPHQAERAINRHMAKYGGGSFRSRANTRRQTGLKSSGAYVWD